MLNEKLGLTLCFSFKGLLFIELYCQTILNYIPLTGVCFLDYKHVLNYSAYSILANFFNS